MNESRSPFVRDWASLAWMSFRRLLDIVRTNRGLLTFSVILLVTDLIWILYHSVGRTLYELDRNPSFYEHELLVITKDGALPEWFAYAKVLLIVILLVRLARSTRQPIYAAWTLIFTLVLLDDALTIHENVGRYFARLFGFQPPWGLRPGDVGEVMFWSILGALLVPLFLIGLVRSSREHRGNGLAFLLPFGALLFCAAFVDQLYGIYHDAFLLAGVLLDIAEDGGELLAISVICALVLGAVYQERTAARGKPTRNL